MEYTELNIDETLYETEVPASYPKRRRAVGDPREVRAFIPGVIAEVKVRPGDVVQEKEVLLLLEAMKMFNEVTTACPGTVAEITVTAGDRVEKGELLVRISSDL